MNQQHLQHQQQKTPLYFCGKKSIQINNSSLIQQIKEKIKQLGSFHLSSKYYTFLSKKNVNNLKENSFLVSLRSFGKNFILFIATINQKNYCVFINKKNEVMNIVQFQFAEEIYQGTIFDGELVKNSNNKWLFIINDIAYYKGKNIITEKFTKRQDLISHILKKEYNANSDYFYIIKKEFFGYEKINDLVDRYQKCLNYKHSGLYFKNIDNFSDNYLFIFPECRTDSKILNNGVTIDNQKVIIEENDENSSGTIGISIQNIMNTKNSQPNNHNQFLQSTMNNNLSSPQQENSNLLSQEEEDLFGENELVEENLLLNTSNLNKKSMFVSGPSSQIVSQHSTHDKLKLDKITCNFMVNPTNLPDVYELYCFSNNNNVEKYSYAAVPDLDTNKLLKDMISFENINDDIHKKIQNQNIIYMECNYHKKFKKWVPFKKAESMDSIHVINQTQIILDSL
jgi:hypothetical protein